LNIDDVIQELAAKAVSPEVLRHIIRQDELARRYIRSREYHKKYMKAARDRKAA
jgi:peptide methionine sulfoxide reductase MsrA